MLETKNTVLMKKELLWIFLVGGRMVNMINTCYANFQSTAVFLRVLSTLSSIL